MDTTKRIMDEWKVDGVINKFDPAEEIIKIAKIHHKYLDAQLLHKVAEKRIMREYAKIEKRKIRYYEGKMTKEELETFDLEQFQEKLTKSAREKMLEQDEDLIAILEKKEDHEHAIYACENILKMIHNRNFQINEYRAWIGTKNNENTRSY